MCVRGAVEGTPAAYEYQILNMANEYIGHLKTIDTADIDIFAISSVIIARLIQQVPCTRITRTKLTLALLRRLRNHQMKL